LTGTLQTLIPNYDLTEEIFLVRDLSRGTAIALSTLTSLLAVGVLWALFRAARRELPGRLRGLDPIQRLGAFVLAVYLGLYSLFNIWWLPESVEFWVSLIPVSWLLAGLLGQRTESPERRTVLLSAGVGILFLVNLFGSVIPQTDRSRDYWYNFNDWLIHNTTPADLVVTGSGYVADGYIRFYSGATVVSTAVAGQDPWEAYRRAVNYCQPERVLISSTVAAPPRQLTNRTVLDTTPAAQFFADLRPNMTLVHADGWQDVYRYRAP
jgi:hypothetical protein